MKAVTAPSARSPIRFAKKGSLAGAPGLVSLYQHAESDC
jgi:hypothetical protein